MIEMSIRNARPMIINAYLHIVHKVEVDFKLGPTKWNFCIAQDKSMRIFLLTIF